MRRLLDLLVWATVIAATIGAVTFGTPSPRPNSEGFLKVIDTDCSRGGWLTALEVGSGRIVQANQLGETRVKGERGTMMEGCRPA